jgi:putative hydrolase of the HAD superfamily
LLNTPREIRDGVNETLGSLALRHQLILFTKGHREEQENKINNSGIREYFEEVIITHEKNATVYEKLVRKRCFDFNRTWMIGNSPRSDINPALEAGLNAVFIPHDYTWSMENEPLKKNDERLIVLDHIQQLTLYF